MSVPGAGSDFPGSRSPPQFRPRIFQAAGSRFPEPGDNCGTQSFGRRFPPSGIAGLGHHRRFADTPGSVRFRSRRRLSRSTGTSSLHRRKGCPLSDFPPADFPCPAGKREHIGKRCTRRYFQSKRCPFFRPFRQRPTHTAPPGGRRFRSASIKVPDFAPKRRNPPFSRCRPPAQLR